VHAPCEDKSDDVKDSFYEELACVFDQFPRYDVKILLGDFNAKVGREYIFKPTTENENSHETTNDNGVRAVNFVTSKNLIAQSTIFLIAAVINTPGPLLMDRHTTRSITL
jgi:hypothetical protein